MEDLAVLERIPGLGKKTAQKIVLQLRGNLVKDDEGSGGVPSEAKDVVEALTAMGFDSRGSLKAVEEILADSEVRSLSGEERGKRSSSPGDYFAQFVAGGRHGRQTTGASCRTRRG